MTPSEIIDEANAKKGFKAIELAKYEQALRDAYELELQLKIQYRDRKGDAAIVKLAMVKAKIVIIKKKIRDL